MVDDGTQMQNNLALLTEIVIAEQNNYWLRFTAFSALSAALIVAAFSLKADTPVAIFGLIISLVWAVVQYASYHYVTHYDRIWEPQIIQLGFRSRDGGFWAGLPRTTFFGFLIAIACACFWFSLIIEPSWYSH